MAEWLVEEGIGEHRALRMDGGRAVAAMIDWPGKLAPGRIDDAVLIDRATGSARGTVRFAGGEEALVDRLPREASEGASLRVEVIRTQIAEHGRTKRARARLTDAAMRPAPGLRENLGARLVRRFPTDDWAEIWTEAWSGIREFASGALQFSTTPAMTLVDVDGDLPPRQLALAAAQALGDALPRYDLRGSIGIDFPTLPAKADRRAVDDALSSALVEWPHERTAMNGFGFVQIVSRLERPSILHRMGEDRAGAAARMLLRRGEAQMAQPGDLLLTCHPAVRAQLRPEWLEELQRRTGRALCVETDPKLALEAGFAQAVPR